MDTDAGCLSSYIVKIKRVRHTNNALRQTSDAQSPGPGCLRSDACLPHYATPHSAGADLCADLDKEILLQPGQRCSVPTGWALELPDTETTALVFARSGLAARQGLCLTNGVGVIDADFRGEICVLLSNHGHEDVLIEPGQRIAQIVFLPIRRAGFEVVEDLTETERGSGGFGSTG
ncbi:MAG: dUTP diphosphatase [Peptococcaceae bacterium]|nr:dUTP diphosphatase [Peptococcaceae bacterium]